MVTIRPITENDDAAIASIVRANLKKYSLDIPGTAYFDPELNSLSTYYSHNPKKRAYFIADDSESVLGGIGIAEFAPIENCAELQKLYLTDSAKGKGLGRKLLERAFEFATSAGYEKIYLETHSNLFEALRLYEKLGFVQIDRPKNVLHGTMNLFYIKYLNTCAEKENPKL